MHHRHRGFVHRHQRCTRNASAETNVGYFVFIDEVNPELQPFDPFRAVERGGGQQPGRDRRVAILY